MIINSTGSALGIRSRSHICKHGHLVRALPSATRQAVTAETRTRSRHSLRDYQWDCVNSIEEGYRKGLLRLLVTLPTGAGVNARLQHHNGAFLANDLA
jgi:hypothetical protein